MKLNSKLLTNYRITLLLTALLFLTLVSAVTMLFTPVPRDIIVSNYPVGFLQALGPISWLTILLFSLLGSLIIFFGKPSRFNQYYFLCVALTLIALKVTIPLFITKTVPVPDAYDHYKAVSTVVSTGQVPESGVFTLIYSNWWPGSYVFEAMFQEVSNLGSAGVLIFVPVLLQVFIAILIFLTCKKLFGQQTALMSLLVLANLMVPVQESINVSPYLLAFFFAILLLYSKMGGMRSTRNHIGYAALGLIILPAMVSTHLFLSLGAGVFLAGMYVADKMWAPIAGLLSKKRIRAYALVAVCLATVVFSMFLGSISLMPLLAFLLGVYMPNVLWGLKSRKFGGYLFMMLIIAMLVFLFSRSTLSTELYEVLFSYLVDFAKFAVSFSCGFYIGAKARKGLIIEEGGEREQASFFYDKVNALLQKIPLLALILITTFLWWMSRSPQTFSDFAILLSEFLAQFRIQLLFPQGMVSQEYAFQFAVFNLWQRMLEFLVTVAIVVGIFLTWKLKTGRATKFVLLAGGATATWLISKLGAPTYFSRYISMFSLFGIIAFAFIIVACRKTGLRGISALLMSSMIVLMSVSPFGAFAPNTQSYYMYGQDEMAGKFAEDKFPIASVTGDVRCLSTGSFPFDYLHVEEFIDFTRHKNPQLLLEPTWPYITYLSLSKTSPYRLVFEGGADLEATEDSIAIVVNNPSLNRIYDNDYNFFYRGVR